MSLATSKYGCDSYTMSGDKKKKQESEVCVYNEQLCLQNKQNNIAGDKKQDTGNTWCNSRCSLLNFHSRLALHVGLKTTVRHLRPHPPHPHKKKPF